MRKKMTLCILLAIVATAPAILAQGDLFDPPVAYDVGDWPRTVVAADLDNDGDSDLVVANHNSDNLSILWNQGGAIYAQPGELYTVDANAPIMVAAGDLTSDGYQDLIAVSDTSGSVSILVNNGDGTFLTPAATYPVGTQAKGIVVAFIDDDEHFDLAVVLRTVDSIAILINDGSGSFPPPYTYYHVVGSQPSSIVANDFNGDGHIDLATGNTEPNQVSVSLFWNDGTGIFAVPPDTISVDGYNTGRICGADIDSDGDADLALPIEEDSDVCVLRSNGDGTFQSPEYYDGVGDYTRSFAPADYDSDGDLDLVVGNLYGGQISVMYNDGAGNFALPTDDYAANSYPTQVTWGDLDNDGDPDIAVNNLHSQTISVLLNAGAPDPADSLILPSMEVMGCEDDWQAAQRVQVKTSVPLYGFAMPVAVPAGVVVDSVSTTGCETEDWVMPFDSITTEFVFVVLASGAQPSVEPGLHSVLNLHYRLLDTLDCGEEGLIHWDTTYSENPDWNLSFVDSGYNTIPAGFDYDRDSTTLTSFTPGDCDGNCTVDIADMVCLVSYMFQSGPEPHFYRAMDVAASGDIDIADLVKLVNWMFGGGAALDCGQPQFVPWPLPKLAQQGTAATRFDGGNTRIVYTTPTPLLGIQLELVGVGSGEPVSALENGDIEVLYGQQGDRLKVGILDMQGAYPIEAGEHVLLDIPGQWEIVSALAADQNFQTIQPSLGRIEPELPKDFSLGQNYPNPFNPTTEINFALPSACDVSLEIYNITGQRVTTLVDEVLEAGQHSVLWDASMNASGVYFYRLSAGEFTETRKMMLLK